MIWTFVYYKNNKEPLNFYFKKLSCSPLLQDIIKYTSNITLNTKNNQVFNEL